MAEFIIDNPWFAAFILISGMVEAFRRWVWPLIKSFVHFIEALPVLTEIAEQFKPDGGESLRDRVDKIDLDVGEIKQQLETLIVEERNI